ncbi:MAG: hypothetical protein AVDCRST_MAG19-241 [uncultured Thermomicrobiales bacterium]|uniref:Uncharacterized protein n=1 Tax=uncultured Thermomicrobiales bacterium TaxID=1645740 RepID=A0A6J4UC80_9BACT|nr:MAG: hypothetical protein AVDCRST_MAG19-241 [uncultured Thermomicrobiales bacterium]
MSGRLSRICAGADNPTEHRCRHGTGGLIGMRHRRPALGSAGTAEGREAYAATEWAD